MQLSKEKRKFVAENAAETAKYSLSIVILGQLISSSVSWRLIVGSDLAFIVLIVFAILIYPDD